MQLEQAPKIIALLRTIPTLRWLALGICRRSPSRHDEEDVTSHTQLDHIGDLVHLPYERREVQTPNRNSVTIVVYREQSLLGVS